jgi:hypothetical protein
MTQEDSDRTTTRRTVLKTVPAVAASTMAVGTASAVTATLSPLAAQVSGWFGSVPEKVTYPTYGPDSVPAFHIEHSEDSFAPIEEWVADADGRGELTMYRHAESKHTVVYATPQDIGIKPTFRGVNQTLVDAASIEFIDLVQNVQLVEPVAPLPPGPEAASLPEIQQARALIRGADTGIDAGLAYDEDISQSTLADVLEAANAEAVSGRPDGSGYAAAIVDTGVDDTVAMEDSLGNTRILAESKDYAGTGETGVDAVEDGQGHGTHVAETVAGNSSDSEHDGWAPGADVLGVRVLNDGGSGTTAAVAAGIRYAADQGADVINLSLGGLYGEAIDRAVSYAAGAGAVVVAASGNARLQGRFVSHPASNEDAIAVAATTVSSPEDLKVASFSSPGPQAGIADLSAGATAGRHPDIGAPGTAIETATQPHLSGTSMAAPSISGAALWILSETGLSDPSEVKERLKRSAAPAPNAGLTDIGTGGFIDIEAALNDSAPEETQRETRNTTAVQRDEANRARANALGGAVTQFLG